MKSDLATLSHWFEKLRAQQNAHTYVAHYKAMGIKWIQLLNLKHGGQVSPKNKNPA